MRTSLIEIKLIEDFLTGKLTSEDSLLFRAKMIIDPVLKSNTTLQKKIYSLIKVYSRRQLKSEIEQLHNRIFNDSDKAAFQQDLYKIFENKDNL